MENRKNFIFIGDMSPGRKKLEKYLLPFVCETAEEVYNLRRHAKCDQEIVVVLFATNDDTKWDSFRKTVDAEFEPNLPYEEMLETIYKLEETGSRFFYDYDLSYTDDCGLALKARSRNIFDGVKVVWFSKNYALAKMRIDLADYSDEEIQTELAPYKFTVDQLITDYPDAKARYMIAKCVLENHAAAYATQFFRFPEGADKALDDLLWDDGDRECEGSTPKEDIIAQVAKYPVGTRVISLYSLNGIEMGDEGIVYAAGEYGIAVEWVDYEDCFLGCGYDMESIRKVDDPGITRESFDIMEPRTVQLAKCPICGEDPLCREEVMDGTAVYKYVCQKDASHVGCGKSFHSKNKAVKSWNERCEGYGQPAFRRMTNEDHIHQIIPLKKGEDLLHTLNEIAETLSRFDCEEWRLDWMRESYIPDECSSCSHQHRKYCICDKLPR